ncbi:MAG: CbtA family protein [Actinobacteria bacterium]|nr:CbtA family protein [Actinomycetota bacterium]
MRNVFVRGAVSGAAAGLATSLAAYFFLEPTLDAAIALEGPSDGGGPVGRETQKLLGMPLGFVFAGLALGLLFAFAYRVLPSRTEPWQRSLGLAAGGFAALALIPALRYPANPPGVGDPETIAGRTSGYLLAVALGVLVVTGSYGAVRALRARGVSAPVRQSAVVVLAVLVVAVGFALLPDNTDPVGAPAALVWEFRIRSLGLLVLLYAVLGATFGALSLRAQPAGAASRSAELLV